MARTKARCLADIGKAVDLSRDAGLGGALTEVGKDGSASGMVRCHVPGAQIAFLDEELFGGGLTKTGGD